MTGRINLFLTLLALAFVGVGCFLQWELAVSQRNAARAEAAYRAAMEEHERRNVYYDPEAIIAWLRVRQHPAGYFVPNPDLMFEPSQRNANTLRATRYAVATLRELDALDRINGRAVVEFVLSNHVPDVLAEDPDLDSGIYRHGPYAAFRTLEGEPVGVRPTMDALIILEAFGALDDPRIDLQHITRFILAHQNPDGGFWDEHYPRYGRSSCMKCTSFALRALRVIYGHTGTAPSKAFTQRVAGFVARSRDETSGGYAARPGESAGDLYDVFRAFITLWSLGVGDTDAARNRVETTMDVDRSLLYANRNHYLAQVGAYARYRDPARQRPSLKASHLLVWMATAMERPQALDREALIRFAASTESRPGEYGGDIYSTYSATGIFRKLGAPTQPLVKPAAPHPYHPPFPVYFPPLFFVLALATLTLGYLARRKELETINRLLQAQAQVDGLTGVLNRRRFEELLEAEISRVQRYDQPLSLILLDADHFKEVNDRYGHLTGDEVLRRLARLISEQIREPDVFARWGGEEFVVLLPGTSLEDACRMAEKLRRLVMDESFGRVGSLTVSIGVAQYRRRESTYRFLERADRALYQAKRNGRNRVCTDEQADLSRSTPDSTIPRAGSAPR